MATAEEIRAAVKRTDEEKIEARANAAATVGELAEKRGQAVAALAEVDEALRSAVDDAQQVMSLGELADFTSRSEDEVNTWAGVEPEAKGRVGRSRSKTTRPVGGRRKPSATRGTASPSSADAAPAVPKKVAEIEREAEDSSAAREPSAAAAV